MRRFAIGDIHGCSKALRTLIEEIDPQPEDELIFLGDYIDRGPDSRNVVDQVIELRERCRVVTLRGNHEIMMMGVALGGLDDTVWLANGGRATVTSYGGCLSRVPADHLAFFQELLPYYETSDSIFLHAGYDPALELHEQSESAIYWTHLPSPLPQPHKSGKRVVLGHTPQPNGDVLDGGHVVCIDTFCFGSGYLTAYEIDSCNSIQADRHGHLRRIPLMAIASRLNRIRKAMQGFCRQQLRRPAVNSNDTTDSAKGVNLAGESVKSP